VETGIPVFLLSAPGAAASVGPAWFAAVAASAAVGSSDTPIDPIFDCGSMPGYALAALRHGLKTIRYDGASFDAIAEMAAQRGATVLRGRPLSLDLGEFVAGRDADAALIDACRRWLRDRG
jgi:hypothetical protein